MIQKLLMIEGGVVTPTKRLEEDKNLYNFLIFVFKTNTLVKQRVNRSFLRIVSSFEFWSFHSFEFSADFSISSFS